MSQVTSVAESVSAPVAGSDRPPRSAALRFGGRSLNPGSKAGRAPPVASAGGPSPARCPRAGRCGAGAPVAPRVLGRFRSQAERLSSGRRVEARSAALRSVDTPAPRASRRPRAPTEIRPVPAPSCTFVPGREPHMPLRGRVSDSDGLLPRPRTPGRVWPRKALRRAYTTSEESRRWAAHPRSGEGPRRPPHECDDTHGRKSDFNLHSPSGWGLMNPSPPRERNSPDRPPQSSGGPPARPEELTRGVEIPGQPGGSAGTWGPERTGQPRSISRGPQDKLELTTRPSRARTTEPTNPYIG